MNNNIKIALISALLLFSTFLNAQEWAEIEKKLPNPEKTNIEHLFGYSIDIQGDYVVVGALGYDNNKGIAYIYHFNGTEWEYQANLKASDASNGDNFGIVSIDGDIITVSAMNYNSGQGKVYVFEKSGAEWSDMTETTSLTTSTPYRIIACTLSGNTIVIGAYDPNNFRGIAYVYEKTGSTWSTNPTATLEASDAADGDFFCVPAIDNDVIVIGAPGKGAGVAYVFEKSGANWHNMTETAKLTSTDAVNGDDFAENIAIEGNNIAIACPGINSLTGKVYVFEKSGTNWSDMTETSTLTASNGVADDQFGIIDIDGNDIVVGTQNANNAIGAAYIYTKTGTTWNTSTETAIITASDGITDDKFGSVAVSNGKILVGAYQNDENDENSGAVYSFIKPQTVWETTTENQKILAPAYYSAKDFSMGNAVAMYGNYAVVGSYGWNNYQGCAIVYKFDGSQWNYQTALIASDGEANDYFGSELAIYDDIIIVGLPNRGEGAIYVYQIPQTVWTDSTEIAILGSDNYNTNNRLGQNIDIFEDVIVTSSYTFNTYGAVLVYKKPITGWESGEQTATLTYSVDDYIGFSNIDIDSNYIAVSCPEYSGTSIEEGAVLIFNKQTNWSDATEDYIVTNPNGYYDFEHFGEELSILGDILAVTDQFNKKVLIFENSNSNWDKIAELSNSGTGASAGFANSIELNNNYILVSNTYENTETGVCYLYNKPASGFWTDTNTETLLLSASDGENYDKFSSGLASYGEYIFIGASKNDDYGSQTGSAYIFKHCYSVNITAEPQEIIACENGDGSTFIQAEGHSLSYQWQNYDGNVWSIIAGETDSVLNLSNISINNSLQYRCIVTGVCYSDTSEVANLSIFPKPEDFSVIGQNSVDEFETVSYSVPYNTDLTYYWNATGGNIVSVPSNNNVNIQWGTSAIGHIYVVAEDINTCKSDTMSLDVNIGGFVNINHTDIEENSIYPNPANNFIVINNNKNINKYSIIDVTGKTVLTSTKSKINISKIDNGIYFIKFDDNKVRKFIIKH